ncbi:MAG: hypothetical protein ACM3NF_05435 [Gemmatimonadota bacterium]
MPDKKRILRYLPFILLLSALAAGCDFLDKGEWDYRVDTGPAPPSGSTIDIAGGAGTVGNGGDGDQDTGIWTDSYGPLGLKIYGTGAADASFTLDIPTATPDFGAEPLTVAADLTVPVYDADPADNNVYYFLVNDSTLYHKVDDFTIDAVTGIRVNAGVTLTLGINSDFNGNPGYETAALALENDLEVLGTLRTAAFADAGTQESGDPNDRGGLALEGSGGVFIRPSGIVSTAGHSATTGRGGHGGAIRISLSSGATANGGILVNEGTIDASGGSTADPNAEGGSSAAYGGWGYRIELYGEALYAGTGAIRADAGTGGTGGQAGGPYGNAFYIGSSGTIENAGAISMAGGTGTNGDGGIGGSLEMVAGESGAGAVRNSGAITTRGGDGTANGGSAGSLAMYVASLGDVLNSGTIDARGGDSTGTDDSSPWSGGQGGQVFAGAYGGRLVSSGSIEAGGGDVANRNPGSYAGQGGYVDFESYADYSGGGAQAGDMEISGTILARGGAGPNGGYGGAVYLYYDDSNGTGGIVLRGYAALVADGGSGVAYGGGGGGIYLYDDYSGIEPGGGLLAEAGLSANGGNAADSGGSGGYVELWSATPPSQYGAITVDGGTGTTPGDAGTISIDGGGIL